LHPYGIADARILYADEFGVVDLAGLVETERLPHCRRPQQTADVISAKGRTAIAWCGQH
jgi:hypothetical protein